MRSKTGKLFCAALGVGALILTLRLQLYRVGFDHKNILSSSHPLHLICLALTGVLAAVLALLLWKTEETPDTETRSPGHPLEILPLMNAGILMIFHSVPLFREAEGTLTTVRTALSLAAGESMVLCALWPREKTRVHGILHGLITVFYAVDMLCRYRNWSGNPQLPDYTLQIFACLLLSLCSYHRLALDVGLGKRRSLLWCSLMAMSLSLGCASGPESKIFYLAGAFWAAGCVCTGKAPAESPADPEAEEAPGKDIRILFFDIDGTLVDPETGRISDKTKEALNRLRETGRKLFIATGRPPASLPDLSDVEFDGFITVNGSLSYNDEGIIHHTPLAPEAVKKVIQNAAELGRPVTVATRDRLSANGWDQDLADYYRLAGLELTVDEDFENTSRQDVYQIMLGCREADHPAIIRDVPGADITFSWDRAADVIPLGSGKAQAILKVLQHYGLEPAQAMAFGDGCNDMEMLRCVGTGVAMGNADPRVKAIAKAQCPPVWEEGIFHYCLDQGLF